MTQIIDLRSDTVTRPSKSMLDAMTLAKVGDDVFGDDPTVIELEQKSATMFGKDKFLLYYITFATPMMKRLNIIIK